MGGGCADESASSDQPRLLPTRPPVGSAQAAPPSGTVVIRQLGTDAVAVPPPTQPLRPGGAKAGGGGDLGSAGLSDLIAVLSGGAQDQKLEAITRIGLMGPAASLAVPTLAEQLKDEQRQIRLAAVSALGRIGPTVLETVTPLIQALDDSDTQVRGTATMTLGRYGAAARDAVPALVNVLRYGGPIYGAGLDSAPVRRAAAQALGQIGPAASAAVPALNLALQDPDFELRRLVLEALNKIGG